MTPLEAEKLISEIKSDLAEAKLYLDIMLTKSYLASMRESLRSMGAA